MSQLPAEDDHGPTEEKPQPRFDLGFKPFNLGYLQHPPRIRPNYGKKKVQLLPKSNVTRVLLYDNMTQEQMLHMKLANISLEKHRMKRILDLHRKSFVVKRLKRLRQMEKDGVINSVETRGEILTLPQIPEQHQIRTVPNMVPDSFVLPELTSKQSLTNLETVDGITRIFNTFQVNEHAPVAEEGTVYEKSVQDPRFQSLQGGLVHLENPGDGYSELSPSFVRDYSSISKNIRRIGLPPLVSVDTCIEALD